MFVRILQVFKISSRSSMNLTHMIHKLLCCLNQKQALVPKSRTARGWCSSDRALIDWLGGSSIPRLELESVVKTIRVVTSMSGGTDSSFSRLLNRLRGLATGRNQDLAVVRTISESVRKLDRVSRLWARRKPIISH